jgi:hypothetical protein
MHEEWKEGDRTQKHRAATKRPPPVRRRKAPGGTADARSTATAQNTMVSPLQGDRFVACSAYARTDPIMHRATESSWLPEQCEWKHGEKAVRA